MKIGVYVCECGVNIAATVDVEKIAENAKSLPNVAVSRFYKYMCSDPGQELIKKDIKDIVANEKVLAYNTETKSKTAGVVGSVDIVIDELFVINEGLIETSNQHPFYTKKQDGSLVWATLNKTVTIEELPSLYFV